MNRVLRSRLVRTCTVGAVAATVALSGCTGSDGAQSPTAPTSTIGSGTTGAPSVSAEPSSEPAGSVVETSGPEVLDPAITIGELPKPADIGNDADKRAQVSITKCAAVDGGWSASGEVNNTGKKTADYTITVFFTSDRSTTIDSATAEVEVKAGETGKWEATKKFVTPEAMLCVLRGVG